MRTCQIRLRFTFAACSFDRQLVKESFGVVRLVFATAGSASRCSDASPRPCLAFLRKHTRRDVAEQYNSRSFCCSRATSRNQQSHWLGTPKPHHRCGCGEWFVQVRRCNGIGRLMSQNRPALGSTEATQKGCGTWRGKRAFPMSEYGCYRLLPASTGWRIGQNGGRRSASKPLIKQRFSGPKRIISNDENHKLYPRGLGHNPQGWLRHQCAVP